MCFNQEMTLFFSALGTVVSIWAFKRTGNWHLFFGLFYFVLMELLQFFQYQLIDECDEWWNKVLTVVGLAHISFQPFFTHLANLSLVRSKVKVAQKNLILRLCFIQGLFMFSRYFTATPEDHISHEDNTEWLRGTRTCTFSGNYHLAWELPLKAPTYMSPSNFIHFFMMFAPFFAMEARFMLNGIILFIGGPYLASVITPNLYEQASIWCFFSISQICLIVLYLKYNMTKMGRWGNPDLVAGKHAKTNGKHSKSNGVKHD